jgi:hypothetical protein
MLKDAENTFSKEGRKEGRKRTHVTPPPRTGPNYL